MTYIYISNHWEKQKYAILHTTNTCRPVVIAYNINDVYVLPCMFTMTYYAHLMIYSGEVYPYVNERWYIHWYSEISRDEKYLQIRESMENVKLSPSIYIPPSCTQGTPSYIITNLCTHTHMCTHVHVHTCVHIYWTYSWLVCYRHHTYLVDSETENSSRIT